MKKMKTWGVGLLALFCVISVLFAYGNSTNMPNKMVAQSVTIANMGITSDVTIAGEEVKDAFFSAGAPSYHYLFLTTKSGGVYVTTTLDLYSKGAASTDGSDVVRQVVQNDGTPLMGVKQVAIADNGGSGYLITPTPYPIVWFLMEDGGLYVWGYNIFGQYGNGTKDTSYTYEQKLTKIEPVSQDGTKITGIKKVIAGTRNTFLLTDSGEVYGCGDNTYMQLLEPTETLPESLYFMKMSIDHVKDMVASDCAFMALKEDGTVYTWGVKETRDVVNASVTPKKAEDLENIVSIGEPIYGGYSEFSAMSADGTVFTGINTVRNNTSAYSVDFGSYITDPNTAQLASSNGSACDVVSDGKVYIVNSKAISSAGTPIQYELNKFTKDKYAVKVYEYGNFGPMIITDDGSFYAWGYPVIQSSIAVNAWKPDHTLYESSEKYNDSLNLNIVKSFPSTISQEVKVKYRDLPSGAYSEPMDVIDDNVLVDLSSEQRIYREYYFYSADVPEKYRKSFIVDLYRHPFDTTKMNVNDSGILPLHEAVSWEEDNGLAGNTTAATLTKPDGSTVTYESGTAISVEGSYSLHIEDLYGNEITISFEVIDVPIPQAMNFTPAGDLIYHNTYTQAGGILGELTLTYDSGKPVSEIKAIKISDGNADGYFDVEQDASTKKTKLKAKQDVPAGAYTLKLTGTDENDMRFIDFSITVQVDKASNPITWNAATQKIITDHLMYGAPFTLGVDQQPGEMKVEYRLAEPNANVTVASDGIITVNTMPANTMNITVEAVPSGTTNYDLTPLRASITIEKHRLQLKTVIGTDELDQDTITLADDMPIVQVIPVTPVPNGITLPRPTGYTYYDQRTGSPVDAITKAGTYEIRPVYAEGAIADYDVTWGYARLIVNDVKIDGSNASDFYTLLVDDGADTPYELGTWSNHDIKVKPMHSKFSKIGIDGETPTSGVKAYTNEQDGTIEVNLVFENSEGVKLSTKVTGIKIDKTPPVIPEVGGITYITKPKSLLRVFSFDQLFANAQTATFHATDALSGVAKYHYVVNEVNEAGAFLGKLDEGDGTSVDLDVNKNYELQLTAMDQAGNISPVHTETIKIDDRVPALTATATITSTGAAYDGAWTNEGITITLSCPEELHSYEYSTDGTTFIPMSKATLVIPNTANVNNVTYIFRGTTATGLQTTANVTVNIDQEQPQLSLMATSAGATITSGTITEEDVLFTLSNLITNISGITYYYTTDSDIASTDPTASDSKWDTYTDTLTVSENGMKTYYFKAVNGAKVSSNLISFDVDMQKKVYLKPTVTASVKGTAYTGDWTNQDVEIKITGGLDDMSLLKGYEYCITDGTTPTKDDFWTAVPQSDGEYRLTIQTDQDHQSYWFRVDEKGILSDPVLINIDKRAPIMESIAYQDQPRSTFISLLNTLTFDQYFKDAQTATFHGSDLQPGSGIKEYQYILSIVNDDGDIVSSSSAKKGSQVNLAKDRNYKLEVTAIDEAGNTSTPMVQWIKIDEKIGSFEIDATTSLSNQAYQGQWTSEPIKIQLRGQNDIVEYAWSQDNVTFTPMTTNEYEISNTANRDGEQFYFRAKNAKGDLMVQHLTVNMDIDTPEVTVTGESAGQPLASGDTASEDITLTLTNPAANLSKEAFYYTNDASVALLDPKDPGSGWRKMTTNQLTLTTNETATYYFAAVSGAGLHSSITTFDVVLQKKAYTKPIVKASSDGKLYQSGSWTNKDIEVELTGGIADPTLITAYEYTTTASPNDKPDPSNVWNTIAVQNQKGMHTIAQETASATYWFRVPGSSILSSPLKVKLDQTNPHIEDIKLTYQNSDGLSQFLNMITFGAWFNQEIDAEVIAKDNFSTGQMLQIEVQEIKDGVAGPWMSYTSKLHYGDGTNLKLRARVKDAAGNISDPKDSDALLLDLTAPTVNGVKDHETYHLMRYVTFDDQVSHINDAKTTYRDGAGDHTLTSPASFRGQGTVTLHVEDQAGNVTEVSFEIVPLPVIDDLTDSDADRDLISGIVDEYQEVKDHMSGQERKDFEDWLSNAKEKVKRYVSEVKEPATNIIVSGLEDTRFEEDVELIVEIVTNEIILKDIKLEEVAGIEEQAEVKEAYDIYLKKGEEIVSIPEDGVVKVLIPYTKERQKIKELKVVYIDEDHAVTIHPHKIETIQGSQYIAFETTHFSHYALIGKIEQGDLNKDVNGDGEPDINITKPGEDRPYLNIDTDHDDRPDVNVDLNGDKEADINIDTTGNLIPNVDIDSDGDGKPELNLDKNGDGVADEAIIQLTSWQPDVNVDSPIPYDTMGDLQKYLDADQKTNGGSSSSDQSSLSQTQNPNSSVGGASTGEQAAKTSMLWILTLVSGGVSLTMTLRKRKKKHSFH